MRNLSLFLLAALVPNHLAAGAASGPGGRCAGEFSAVAARENGDDLFEHHWGRVESGLQYSKKGDSLDAIAEVQKRNFELVRRESRNFADRLGDGVPEWQDPVHRKTVEAVRKAVLEYEKDPLAGDSIGDIKKALLADPLFAEYAEGYSSTIANSCFHCPEQTLSADHSLLVLLDQHGKIQVSGELKKHLQQARNFARTVRTHEGRARETSRFADYFPRLKGLTQAGLEEEGKKVDAAIASAVAPRITKELRQKWEFIHKAENIPDDVIPLKWWQDQLASDPAVSRMGQAFWDAMKKDSGPLELVVAHAVGGEELEKLFVEKERIEEGFRLFRFYTPDLP